MLNADNIRLYPLILMDGFGFEIQMTWDYSHILLDGLDFLTWLVGISLDRKLVVFLTRPP